MNKTKETTRKYGLLWDGEYVHIGVRLTQDNTLGSEFAKVYRDGGISTEPNRCCPRDCYDEVCTFLTECLEAEKREALSTFTCEVEYRFELAEDGDVNVYEGNLNTGWVGQTDHSSWISPAVVAAARKFAAEHTFAGRDK